MKKIISALPWSILILTLVLSFILMIGAARSDSAIMDELAHIPAGYGYVKYFDYRLNPEHPPLVKIISAIPLLFGNFKFPADQTSWISDLNGQWDAGRQFLYQENNDADNLIFTARIGPILLTLLLILLTYIWARKLMGRWWALLPAFLIALSPNFLAHGHYVTTDIGATLGTVFATFFFLRYLFKQTNQNLIWAGIAFGIAQLMKFSTVLLIPYFIFLATVFCILEIINYWKINSTTAKIQNSLKIISRYALATILIFSVGYAFVYIAYFITTLNYPIEKQVFDTTNILSSFGLRWLVDINIWMAGNRIFRPLDEYMLGVLMVMQRSAGGNTSYFLGDIANTGWTSYFPMVFLMKETLPALIIILIGFVLGISKTIKSFGGGIKKAFSRFYDYLLTNFEEFAILIFIIFYWGYTMRSTLNIGFRHLLPTLPLIYILSVGSLKKWFSFAASNTSANFWDRFFVTIKKIITLPLKTIFIATLVIWLFISAIKTYPFYLSRFNEMFGGTYGGYKYVTDSNFDWGQDLKRLQEWVDTNNVPKIAIDYFGGGIPNYYLGDKVENWWSSRGNPKDSGINWIAISANSLQTAKGNLISGMNRTSKDEYPWIPNWENPYAKAGTSIFIYKL